MAEDKLSIFNNRNKILDKLYGVPGANELLRYKLLDYMSKMAKTKTYFSTTTYSIIYNLIQSNKIGLFFIPSLRTSNFFTSNVPIQVVGGYDFNLRRIEIMVKWSFGIDMISQLFEAHLPLICNKMFALILSEALLIYNYKHNGELTNNNENIKKWYQIYFESIMGDMLHRSQLAKNLSTIVSENYPTRIFNSIEKAIIEGRDPSVKISKKGENAELDIEGISSIKKGDKELEDIFKDSIEDYVNEKKEEFNIDTSAYNELKEFMDEFANLGSFLYKNRDIYLEPENLEAMPESAFETLNRGKLTEETMRATLHRLEMENQQKEEDAYQKYLDTNPKIKEILEKSRNEKWDKETEKYFGEFTNKIDSTGKIIKGKYASLKDFINKSDPSNNYINYLLNSGNISADDVKDAIEGTKVARNNYLEARDMYIKTSYNPNATNKKKQLARDNLYINQKQAEELCLSLYNLLDNIVYDKSLIENFKEDLKNNNFKVFSTDTFNRMENLLDAAKNAEETRKSLTDDSKRKLSRFLSSKGWDSENGPFNKIPLLNRIPLPEYLPFKDIKSIEKYLNENKAKILNLKSKIEMNLKLAKDGDRHAEKEASKLASELQQSINSFEKLGNLLFVSERTDEKIKEGMRSDEWVNRFKINNQKDRDLINIRNHQSSIFHNTDFFEQDKYSKRQKTFYENGKEKQQIGNISNDEMANLVSDVFKVSNAYNNDTNLKDAIKNGKSGSLNNQSKLGKWYNNDGKSLSKDIERVNNRDLNIIKNGIVKNTSKTTNEIKNDIESYINNKVNNIVSRHPTFITDQNRLKDHVRNEVYKNVLEVLEIGKSIHDGCVNYERANIEDNISYKLIGLKGDIIDIRSMAPNHIKSFERIYKRIGKSKIVSDTERLIKNAGGMSAFFKRKNNREILNGLYNSTTNLNKIDPNKLASSQMNDITKLLGIANKAIDVETVLNLGKKVMRLSPKSSLSPQVGYTRKLFLNGLGYLTEYLPDWETIKYHTNNLKNKSIDLYYLLRSIYRFAKIILPLKSNIREYANQRFGYGIMASYKYFDLPYKIVFKLKKMYELKKGTIRKDMTYSELYMPTTIFKKALYAHLVTQNDYTPEILYLINCAHKGLEEFM